MCCGIIFVVFRIVCVNVKFLLIIISELISDLSFIFEIDMGIWYVVIAVRIIREVV